MDGNSGNYILDIVRHCLLLQRIKELLATGDIIVHISADKLGSIPIPLPPVAEQQRIVKKNNRTLQSIEINNSNRYEIQ